MAQQSAIQIQNKTNNLAIGLSSFDVFDTLITRKTATPKGIFAIMQQKLQNNPKYKSLPPNLIRNFYKLRVHSEQYLRKAYCQNNIIDITLYELYDFIAANHALTEIEKQELISLEIETEKEHIIPIKDNIEVVNSLIDSGQRVILISDMYLPSEIIRELLVSVDPVFQHIKIYSSADIKLTKGSGKLYEYVKNQENISYENWLHTGDNGKTDVASAEFYGIKTSHVPFAGLTPYEKRAIDDNAENPFFQLTIGAARNARFFSKSTDPKKDLGISLAAPILFPYCNWIVEQAQRRNISRLYFIARDGYVLKSITDKILKYKQLNISTHYIYGSREAWRIPSLTKETIDQIFSVFEQKTFVQNIQAVADRFSVTKEELIPFLPEHYKSYAGNLTEEDLEVIRHSLESNQEFKDFILDKNKDKQQILLDYIRQEIDFSDDNFAFVDLQGSGVTQKCLASLIYTFYPKPLKCFYSRANSLPKSISDKYVDLYIEFPSIKYTWFIRELFCRALHGQTLGYERKNGKVVPVLQSEGNSLEKWGYNDFVAGINEFCDWYMKSMQNYESMLSDLSLFVYYYKYLFNINEKSLANLIGSIPFSFDGKNDDSEECAPKYTIKDVLFGAKNRNKMDKYSMLRSKKIIRKLMKFKSRYSK